MTPNVHNARRPQACMQGERGVKKQTYGFGGGYGLAYI